MEDEEFLDEQFEASGSREEFEDLYKKYMDGEEEIQDSMGSIFGNKLRQYYKLIMVQNAYNKWKDKNLHVGELKAIPEELSYLLTNEKNVSLHAYKLKNGLTNKLLLN